MASSTWRSFISAVLILTRVGGIAAESGATSHVAAEAYEAGARVPPGPMTLRRGDTLQGLAAARYGHRYYADLIALHNGIADASRLRPGTSVKLPPLLDLLSEEKLTSVAGVEVERVLCARARYRQVVGRVPRERLARRDQGPFEIPPEVKSALDHAVQDLAEARGGFAAVRPGVIAQPRQLRRQLQSAIDLMNRIAAGHLDSESYDVDMVEQHIALALTYGVVWARDGFR